jgi:hypothetical protein
MKVALAQSAQKSKKNIEDHKCCISEKRTTNIPKSELIPFKTPSALWFISDYMPNLWLLISAL